MKRPINLAGTLMAIGLVAVAAVHVFLFGFSATRLTVPVVLSVAAVVLGMGVHLGLLASLAAWLRRRLHPVRNQDASSLDSE